MPNLFLTEEGFVVKDDVLVGYFGDAINSDEPIVIPDGVTKITGAAMAPLSRATKVVIPEGVTELGSNCFAHFFELKTVVLPKSLKKIGAYAFSDCGMLEELEVPDSVYIIREGFLSGARVNYFEVPENVNFLSNFMFDKSRVRQVKIGSIQLGQIINTFERLKIKTDEKDPRYICVGREEEVIINSGFYCPFGNSSIEKISIDGAVFTADDLSFFLKKYGFAEATSFIKMVFWNTKFVKLLTI